jgi:hypothetical protein
MLDQAGFRPRLASTSSSGTVQAPVPFVWLVEEGGGIGSFGDHACE